MIRPLIQIRFFFGNSIGLFGKPKSPKEIYYEQLALARYNAGLDYGIIPNYNALYDRYV